jgi:RNA polymerase sigma-70 factor (ECF subfamily)
LTSPDVADDVELAESVSMAMLTVLETLLPAERAVFVLREVFELPYDEVAAAVGRSEAAVRQIAHRARGHVAARRPRRPVGRAEQRQVVDRFLAALATGDVQALMDVLAPDVVLLPDGGGRSGTARRPIEGADRLARFLIAGTARAPGHIELVPVWLNGALGIRLDLDGDPVGAMSLTTENGRITRLYAVANPAKLAGLGTPAVLTRRC